VTTTLDPRDLDDLGEVLFDTSDGDLGDEASLVLARSAVGTVMLAGYDGDGTGKLTHFFATNLGERATMLALGRALVDSLESDKPVQPVLPPGSDRASRRQALELAAQTGTDDLVAEARRIEAYLLGGAS